MTRIRFTPLLLACAFLAAAATGAWAQETTGTLSGKVVDSQNLPIPGATITVTGPQGTKTTTSGADGQFTLPFLTPGTYSARVELTGFKAVTRKDLTVSLGQTLALSIQLQPGAVSETVTVAADAPLLNITSSTTGAVIGTDFAARVPVGRRISDLTYMAPGVSDSGAVGRANPSIAGGSGLDNQYVVDGVNVTNQGYGALGSYSIIFGSLGNATPYDFIKEVQVKTGGYEAEFGQSTGGVVNVITKSGTNLLQGSAFAYSSPDRTESAWKQFQSVNGTVQTLGTQQSDSGVEGGGPILRDRLFFFGAVDPQWQRTMLQAPDDFPLRSLGAVDRDRKNVSYSAKATYQLTPTQRIDASFFGDPSTGDLGPQRISALTVSDTTSFSRLEYGGHNQTVRYQGAIKPHWLVEATYGRALNRIVESPSVDEWRVTDQTVSPNVITGGVGFYEQGNRSVNQQWAASSTHYAGRHQIKYGVEYDDVDYSQVNQRTGPTFLAADGRMTATGAEMTIVPDIAFGQIYRVSRANFNTGRITLQKYATAFAEDTWHVGSRLTVTPGVRYEQETLDGTIVTGFKLSNNWAPRIGAAWDPFGDEQTKVYGSFGRFYSRIPNDLAARALSGDDSISRADYFDANLTLPVPDGVVTETPSGTAVTQHFLLAGVGPDTIDPDAKMSYITEYSIGGERVLMRDTTIGVRYIHRAIGRVLEDVANAPLAAYDLKVPGVTSVEYILTNPSSSTPVLPAAEFLGAHFDDPRHVYQAVELTVNRRYANHWSLMGSYRWSRLRGNFEGFFRDDNGQSDPGITSLYDFPTNDPSYTAIGADQFGYRGDIRFLGANGILPLDRPHQGKIFGTYTFDNGLNLGLSLTVSSGKPLTPLAANPNYTNGGEIPEAARGSGFETTDGFRTRTPVQRQLDLQASYRLKIGGPRQITLLAEVFNVFNERQTLDYDNYDELEFGVPNPDFGSPISQNVSGPQFQAPRQVRFGVRFGF